MIWMPVRLSVTPDRNNLHSDRVHHRNYLLFQCKLHRILQAAPVRPHHCNKLKLIRHLWICHVKFHQVKGKDRWNNKQTNIHTLRKCTCYVNHFETNSVSFSDCLYQHMKQYLDVINLQANKKPRDILYYLSCCQSHFVASRTTNKSQELPIELLIISG